MKNSERLELIKAKCFTRQQTEHHRRELTERGKDNRTVYESLQSFRRPLLVRGY